MTSATSLSRERISTPNEASAHEASSEERPSRVGNIESFEKDPKKTKPKKPKIPLRERLLKNKCVRGIVNHALGLSMFTSIILAFVTGYLLRFRSEPYTEREIFYTAFLGKLFSRSLRVLLIPYITACVISAVGRVPALLMLRLTLRTILYFLVTTILAASMGIFLGFIFSLTIDTSGNTPPKNTNYAIGIVEIISNLLMNLVPFNIVFACMYTEHVMILHFTSYVDDVGDESMGIKIKRLKGTNYMGIYLFSVCIGLAIHQLGRSVEWVLCLADTVRELMRIITHWVLWVSPIGLFCLITARIMEMRDVSQTLHIHFLFFALFFLGIFVHCCIIVVSIFMIVTRSNPCKYIFNISWGIFTSFATGTSVNAIPFMLSCVEEKNKVDSRVAQLVVPFGANINMDGRALFLGLTTSYICLLGKMDTTPQGMAFIFFMSVFGSVDMSPHDEMELKMLITEHLIHMGFDIYPNMETLEHLFSFFWFLERIQACANVFGDALGAKVINVLNKKDLGEEEKFETSDMLLSLNTMTEKEKAETEESQSKRQLES